VTSYTWDFRNRLTEILIKTSGGTTVQDDKFTYDVENRRIGKNTLSGGQSWTAYVDSNPFMDFNSSGSLLYRYIYGNTIDFLIGRIDTSGNAMWYLTDKLGSVRENTDGNRNVLDSITYDTYGNILAETAPTSGDRFKYTSREWDSEIGQYFYRARYYSPTDGRFDNEDPLSFSAGDSNLFRYVKNNVINASDPLGTFNSAWHWMWTWRALREAGCSPQVAFWAAYFNADTDLNHMDTQTGMLIRGLGTFWWETIPHAMSGKSPVLDRYLTKDETRQRWWNWISFNMTFALKSGGLEALGRAMHAAQDHFARGHKNFQEWHGLSSMTPDHIEGDDFPTADEIAPAWAVTQLLARAYAAAWCGRGNAGKRNLV
jgi:RHS repeat-associated protein